MTELEKYYKDQEYYDDDGRITNSLLKAIAAGQTEINKYFKAIEAKKQGVYVDPDHYKMGSATDLLLTTPNIFDEIYYKHTPSVPSDTVKSIMDVLLQEYPKARNLNEIPDELLIKHARELELYSTTWKDETILKRVNEGSIYFFHKRQAGNKTVMTIEEYQKVNGLANLIETHDNTAPFFNLEGMPGIKTGKSVRIDWTTGAGAKMHKAKSLLDRLYINLGEDIQLFDDFIFPRNSIMIIDYKTMSLPIYSFPYQFRKYRYDFQGAFYYGAANYQAQKIKAAKKLDLKVMNPVFVVGSFASSITAWYQMTNHDLMVGRLGGVYGDSYKINIEEDYSHDQKNILGYFDAIKLYEEYKDSGQWSIPPNLFYNGKFEKIYEH